MDTRWTVLIHCCIVAFAQDFFYDEPSALVQRLTGVSVFCMTGSDTFCLDLDMLQFNMFFSAYSWACACAALIAGWAGDRYGSKLPLWTSAGFFVLGSLLFVAGSYSSSTSAAYGWLVAGRALNGLGAGGLVTICHRVKGICFQNKELGVAFALHILAGRLGSALNYLVMGAAVDAIGLMGCLWIGFTVTLLGGASAIYLGWLEERAHDMGIPKTWKELWHSLLALDAIFWSFAGVVFLMYGTVSTFTANGAALMASLHGYSESTASYITGIVYDICLLAPLLGYLLDRYGYRDYWISSSAATLLLAFLIYLAPQCPGWVVSTLVGLAYCIFPPTIWSSLPIIVSAPFLGSANGLLKFFQYLGVGTMTTIGGAVLDMYEQSDLTRWKGFILYLMTAAAVALIITGIINWLNKNTGYRLTPSQAGRKSAMDIEEFIPVTSSFADKALKSPTVYGTQTSVLY